MDANTVAAVERALRAVQRGLANQRIDLQASLVADLGFDSIRLVDLTFALQEHLGIDAFPTQDWVDDQMSKDGPRFTVESLVEQCEACLRIKRDVEELP